MIVPTVHRPPVCPYGGKSFEPPTALRVGWSPTNYGSQLSVSCAELIERLNAAQRAARRRQREAAAAAGKTEAVTNAAAAVVVADEVEKCLLLKVVELLNFKSLSKSALQLGDRLQRRRRQRRQLQHHRRILFASSASAAPLSLFGRLDSHSASMTPSLYFDLTLETIAEETELELTDEIA